MATRHLKRLKDQLAAKQVDVEVQPETEASEEDETAAGPAPFNPFDLLSDDDGAAASEAEEDDQDLAEASSMQPAAAAAVSAQPAARGAASSNQNKKNKSKQRKKQSKQAVAAADDSNTNKAAAKQSEEDIDQLLQELDITLAAAPSVAGGSGPLAGQPAAAAASSRLPPLLGVDSKKIRGDAELRRMFGAGVVHAVDREQGSSSGRGRMGGAAASARAAVRRRQLKKCMLATAADHWPNVDSGISMKQDGTAPDGLPRFVYSWSPNYAAAQRVFEQAQASHDPNAVAAVLHQFPYHVDSLLAMNDLYRSMGEAQTAEDMLARALYALEAAWPHGFDPSTGAVRLDIERAENRGLFVALFRHAQALSRRGCHSAALEVTKLLLALDPEDPMGALLLLDYLALRAGSYAYLERFVSEFDSSHSLALLPNYAFALPLARFRLEQQQKAAAAAANQDCSSSSRSVSSYTLLAQALLLHPRALVELMTKLARENVGKDAAWQSILARKLYAKASDHGSESLGHLISLFVERSHNLWKAQDVQSWLKTAAEAAADVADGKRRGTPAAAQQQGGSSSSRVRPDDIVVDGSAEDWTCVARESFPASGRNEYGHLRLDDFSDTVNSLPQEELQAAMAQQQGMGDEGAIEVLNDMLAAEQIVAAQRQRQGAPVMSEEELRAANPLLMLLQSMLPWVNAGQQPEYAAEDSSTRQRQHPQGGQDDQQQQ